MIVSDSETIVRCYGITKDPETNNFIMVMQYANRGSLRNHLDNKFNSFNWNDKLYSLFSISTALQKIHENDLIHHDFHCGNILNYSVDYLAFTVTDLGLCRPVNEKLPQDG